MNHETAKAIDRATKLNEEIDMLISDFVSSGILLDDNVIEDMEDGYEFPLYMNVHTGQTDVLSAWDCDHCELVRID